MNYRDLAGIRVSEIGFGGWGIGGADWGPTDDNASLNALHAAYDRGITFYDTAPSYGRSEKLIGTAFKHRRDKVVICTKTVDFEIGESLRHFGYIDVLLTHHRVHISEAIAERMEQLVEGGAVRLWGMSAPSPFDAYHAIDQGARAVEANLSMMDQRAIEGALLDKVSVIARTPLNFGFLSGLITEETVFDEAHHLARQPRARILDWIKRSRECLGDTPPGPESVRKAINWVLAHPVSTVVVGMMTREEVEANTA